MKILSVKQPWAYLLCAGVKDIENRTWILPEKYKGEIVLIHASSKRWLWDNFTAYIQGLALDSTFGGFLDGIPKMEEIVRENNFSEKWLKSLPVSAIVGSVRFTDCVINHRSIWAEKSQPADFDEYGRTTAYYSKIYNWVVEDAALFKEPILNVKGRLNFWDYDLSEEEYLNLEKIEA